MPSESDHPEKQLLLDLKAGDHMAFEAIYHKYKVPIISSMLRLMKSPTLVEELVQELFLKIWEGRELVDADRPIKAYLFQIATNMAKNTFRKAYYEKKMKDLLLPFDEQVYSQIESYIEKKENKVILDRILAYLPSQRRHVYESCKIQQLSYKEVAAQLGVSENTINDHIKKANAQIRDIVMHKEKFWIIMVLCIQEFFL